ncbi:MAG: hypothetical protein ACRDHY_13955 [Anaerolineales bacterium]
MSLEVCEKLMTWALDLTTRGAHPSVLVAVQTRRETITEPGLVILTEDLDRCQTIAVLRQAIRQLGGWEP